jgi:hypothetical protein
VNQKTLFLNRFRLLGSMTVALTLVAVLAAGCSEELVSSDAPRSDAALAADGATAVAKAAGSTSLVYTFPGGPDQMLIEGASASLVRTPNGVNFRFVTNSLEAGHAYTLWVVIFNEPASCGTAPCTPPDLFNAAAKPDMLYGTGLVVGGSGKATFTGRTEVGDASGSVQAPAGLLSNGLIDPYSAEFHFVVHHHGPMIPAFMPDMIQTLAGGCQDSGIPETGAPSPWNDYAGSPDYAGEYGELGPNECLSVQFSILTPQ